MKNAAAFLFCLFVFHLSPLDASSIVPFRHLGEAAGAAEMVVLATAEGRFESASGAVTFYDCGFRVKEASKGALQVGDKFIVRQYSHRLGEFEGPVSGDFVPEEGKTYLLFLRRSGEVWRPLTLSYYVFEMKKAGETNLLVPVQESFGIALAPRPDGLKPEPLGVYRPQALLRQLREYATGTLPQWDAAPALTGFSPADFVEERVLPAGCDFNLGAGTTPMVRWQDAAIEVYYDDTDVPSGFDGILSSVLGTMNGEYTGIDPSNEGQVSFSPDCGDGSVAGSDMTAFLTSLNGTQATLIFSEDPCSQIPNLSSCAGTLAVGGSYFSSSTHTYKGETWNNALWGYVVVNNGTFACLSTSDFEVMLIHELTHTYDMDHLDPNTYPGQNMNPSCCNSIGTKDQECMNYTYDLGLPVRLLAFNAQLYREHQARLGWATASEKDNDFFLIERSADGLHFEKVHTVKGHNLLITSEYEWIDALPFPGLNYYRLSQVDKDGQANNLGMRVVQTGAGDRTAVIFPNPANETLLTVLTDFPAAFAGWLDITDANGRILAERPLTLEPGRHKTEQPIGHLPAGLYWLRLREAGSVRVLKFVKN